VGFETSTLERSSLSNYDSEHPATEDLCSTKLPSFLETEDDALIELYLRHVCRDCLDGTLDRRQRRQASRDSVQTGQLWLDI
jgi:hypothetical protein